MVLEKTPESSLDSRKIKLVNLKGDQYFGLMLKLKLQYFGHLMLTDDSLKKSLMLGKIEGRRGRGRQRMRWLDGITNAMGMNWENFGDGEGQGGLVCCSPWGHKESGMT